MQQRQERQFSRDGMNDEPLNAGAVRCTDRPVDQLDEGRREEG